MPEVDVEPGAEEDAAPVTFLGRRLPSTFDVRVVTLRPGRALPYSSEEWRDAMVVVEVGALELECVDGGREHFAQGDVLMLAGLPLRALRSGGMETAVLVAVSRRRAERAQPP